MKEEIIISLIKKLRKGVYPEKNWIEFKRIIQNNIKEVCKCLNTRWLISICDTYVDLGDPVESRNALIVSVFINMEKLAQTFSYMHDSKISLNKVSQLRDEPPFELWDGMTSFHLKRGDLTTNMFRRISVKLEETPEISYIFKTLLKRIKKSQSILGTLNKYHKSIFKY